MRRLALAVALTALPVLASPSHAGGCPLLRDGIDYLYVVGQPVPLPLGAVDIRSGDLASGATTVVAHLRLRDLDDLLTVSLGVRWTFGWTIDGTPYTATYDFTATGDTTVTFTGPSGTVATTGSASRATDDVRWTIPRSLMPELAAPKRAFRNIHATAAVAGYQYDTATTPAAYMDRTVGCIPAS